MKTEYGCEDLAKIRYRVVSTTGINITNGVIGIVLAWYQEVRVKPQLQQDVEEFIDEHELVSSSGSEVNSLIRASDLRAWMTGHVRVPVEPNTDSIVALGIALSSPRPDGETVGQWAERIYKLALNESKGES